MNKKRLMELAGVQFNEDDNSDLDGALEQMANIFQQLCEQSQQEDLLVPEEDVASQLMEQFHQKLKEKGIKL